MELGLVLSTMYKEDFDKGLIKVRDEGNGPFISKWDSLSPQPSDDLLQSMYKDIVKVNSKSKVDAIAYHKIVEIAPEYLQRNMIARSSELLEKMVTSSLTAEEAQEKTYIESIWTRIKTLRSHAAYLKSEIEAGNNPDINAGWSE